MIPWRYSKRASALAAFISRQWSIILLTCLAVFPLFAGLGGDHLWSDEGDTAVLGASILKSGVPTAWDGKTFTDSDLGTRLNQNLVMVSHPWLQYYAAAASFAVFGETAFAARFPFALAGLLTIPVLFALVVRVTGDRKAALSACILLVLSVQFLLFSRQCRNYPLNMLLTCTLVLLFFQLTTRRASVLFALNGVLLFHCNPSGVAPLGALAALTFLKPFAPYRRRLWMAIPFIALLTIPWFFFAKAGYSENVSPLREWFAFVPRMVQFLVECASVCPLVGVAGLFVWIWMRQYRRTKLNCQGPPPGRLQLGRLVSGQLLAPGDRVFLLAAGMIVFAYAGLIAVTQSRSEIFGYGLRHATPVIPLAMGVAGLLISKASRNSVRVWMLLMLVFTVTRAGRITPWSFLHEPRSYFDGTGFVAMHVPERWIDRIFQTALVSFSRDLCHPNRGTVARVCEVLSTNAAPDDILITNYEWEPLYFHTGLPQGLKVMPHYPIYAAARERQLPEYVFSVENVRWVVCRWPWDGYRDYDLEAIYEEITRRGATVTPIATVRETTWENRPELHYRRYPGPHYKYPWFVHDTTRRAEIYRIDWPERSAVSELQ